jgi:transposase
MTNKFAPEVRARAVRKLIGTSGITRRPWAAVVSISGKVGRSAYTLHEYLGQASAYFASAELNRLFRQ